jgi:hypothetical protein
MAKLKTYMASSVWLTKAPDCHAASNGGKQFFIVVRAKNKQVVADMLGASLTHLNNFGFYEVQPKTKYYDIPLEDNTIYYNAGHTANGFEDRWFVYDHTKDMDKPIPRPEPPATIPPVRIVEEHLSDNSVAYNIRVRRDGEDIVFPCVSEKAARWASEYFDKALKIAAGDWDNV